MEKKTRVSFFGLVELKGEPFPPPQKKKGKKRGRHWAAGPQPRAQLSIGLPQHLAGRPEMADVRHARADEDLVDADVADLRERLGVVRVVGAAEDRLLQLVQVDVDDRGILCLLVGLQQAGARQPLLHLADAPRQGTGITVALGDHPLQQRDVGPQVLPHRPLSQLDGAPCRRALCRSIRQLERLLALQVRQSLDLQDAAVEDVLLALLLHGEQSLLDGVVGNGVHQVPQRDPRLHLPREAHQHGLGHVQRHHSGGRGKGHQPGARGEGDAQREAGVGIPPGAHLAPGNLPIQPLTSAKMVIPQ